ncbi:MAG: hypothetical protein ACRCZN_13555 [Lactococcus lactis]
MTSIEMKGAAMSELEKSKQEVEQVCFAYDKAGDTGDIKDWKEYYDLENKLIDKVKISEQSQLTIPKSIADELDKVEMNWNTLKDEAQGWPTDDLIMWLDAGNNPLMFAYLAGKALGVDLVKVVADD